MKKNILKILIALSIIGLVFYLYNRFKPNKTIASTGSSSKPSKSLNCSGYNPQIQVRYGNKSCEVEALQRRLNHYHLSGLSVDGIFGDETMRALTRINKGVPIKAIDIGDPDELISA